MSRSHLCIVVFLFITLGLSYTSLAAQPASEQRAILVRFGYGPQLPAGELADRFGTSWSIQGQIDLLTKKNWLFGLQGQYFFGNEVKQDVLAGLRTEAGFIIGNQRSPADIQLRERGLFLGLQAGRNFLINPQQSKSGILVTLAGGWLLHRIRLQADPAQTVNQVIAEYRAGYDRLTAGPALHQFIGYQNLDARGRLNFYVGIEMMEGFTQSQRDWDFAAQTALTGNRVDLLFGIRAGWILPFYQGDPEEIFY
jgi:hypothetical protein